MHTDLHTRDIALECQILDDLKELGFQAAEPEGLDSPAFPDTFAPSAFHGLVRSCASSESKFSTRWAGSDWVFRHVDLDKIGFSPVHLSAFRMLVFLEAVPHRDALACRERTIQTVLMLLRNSLQLHPDRLYITCFSGHLDLPSGVATEHEIPAMWKRAGVPEENLIAIPGPANLTNVVRIDEPAGPRCEIFLRDEYGTYVEIGTVVFECLVVTKTYPLAFKLSNSDVCGAAFGLERFEMVSRNAREVFDLPDLRRAICAIETDLHPHLAKLGAVSVRRIVDAVRAATIILNNTQQPLSPPRRNRVGCLRKSIERAASNLGCEDIPSLVGRVADSLQYAGDLNTEAVVQMLFGR